MKLAVIFGWNGPSKAKLRHAHDDAVRLAGVLQSDPYGFEVVSFDESSRPNAIMDAIQVAAERCSVDDQFLVSFAGHGVIEAGQLVLLSSSFSPERVLTTGLRVSEVLTALAWCRARQKLLILDCCNAGAAYLPPGARDLDEYSAKDVGLLEGAFQLLLASERFERAKEHERWNGGFLTQSLCDDLERWDDPTNRNKSISGIVSRIKKIADHHNLQQSASVPVPFISGRQGDFAFLTKRTVTGELETIGGIEFVWIPFRNSGDAELLISRRPISNAQYRTFMEAARHPPPQGEVWDQSSKQWKDGFAPLSDPAFGAAAAPVTCVSVKDVQAFCEWFQGGLGPHVTATMTSSVAWEYAAVGRRLLDEDPSDVWMNTQRCVHHAAAGVATSEDETKRENQLGIIDMIGNVWEWCRDDSLSHREAVVMAAVGANEVDTTERFCVKGGGYLDDLTEVFPSIASHDIDNGVDTRHCDLGFRVMLERSLAQARTPTPGRPFQKIARPKARRLK